MGKRESSEMADALPNPAMNLVHLSSAQGDKLLLWKEIFVDPVCFIRPMIYINTFNDYVLFRFENRLFFNYLQFIVIYKCLNCLKLCFLGLSAQA